MQLAPAADSCSTLQRDARMDDGVGADVDSLIDIGRRGIFNRDARRHELRVFLLPHQPAHLRQLLAAVDSPYFVGVLHGHRRHYLSAPAINVDEIRQVIFALGVFDANGLYSVDKSLEGEYI